jgi:hypothetical protein
MRLTTTLQIASVRLDVSAEGAAAEVVSSLADLYPARDAPRTIQVELVSDGEERDGPEGLVKGGVVEVVEGRRVERIDMPYGLNGRIDLDGREAMLHAGPVPVQALSGIRMVFAVCALRTGVLWLHSLAVIRRGRGYLFPGRSGAGKSTLGRTVAKDELLADESVAVTWNHGQPFVASTPFQSAGAVPPAHREAPLTAIQFLRQGATTQTRPLDSADALARLWPCIFSPERAPGAQQRGLLLAADLVEAVPTSELKFRLEPGVINKAIDDGNRKNVAP